MEILDATTLATAVFTVTELIKRTGLNTKWSPIVALIAALLLSWVITPDAEAGGIIFNAIVAAATSMGVYSGAKALAK